MNEYIEALKELQTAVRGLHAQAIDTRDAMGKLVTDSNLRSTLNLLKNDISFRHLLDLQVNHE